MSRGLKTSREQIVGGVLRALDEGGAAGITIRRVGRAAGVPAMSLYSHIKTKDELFDLAREGVAHQLNPQLDGATSWKEALYLSCHHMRQVLLQHPRWLPFVELLAPMDLLGRRRVIDMLMKAGCRAQAALAIVTRAKLLSFGLTTVELLHQRSDGTNAALGELPELRFDGLFASAVEAFLDGLELELSAEH